MSKIARTVVQATPEYSFGRRSTGRMDIRLLDGTKVNASVGYKNLRLLEMRKNYLIEQRKVD